MSKTMTEAVEQFNAGPGTDGYKAEVIESVDTRLGEGFEQIEVLYGDMHIGTFFESVEEFEDWAYEGGDSA